MRRSQHMATSNPPPKVRRVIFFMVSIESTLKGAIARRRGYQNPFAVKAFLEAEKGIQSTSSRAASWAPASEDKSAPAKVG